MRLVFSSVSHISASTVSERSVCVKGSCRGQRLQSYVSTLIFFFLICFVLSSVKKTIKTSCIANETLAGVHPLSCAANFVKYLWLWERTEACFSLRTRKEEEKCWRLQQQRQSISILMTGVLLEGKACGCGFLMDLCTQWSVYCVCMHAGDAMLLLNTCRMKWFEPAACKKASDVFAVTFSDLMRMFRVFNCTVVGSHTHTLVTWFPLLTLHYAGKVHCNVQCKTYGTHPSVAVRCSLSPAFNLHMSALQYQTKDSTPRSVW